MSVAEWLSDRRMSARDRRETSVAVLGLAEFVPPVCEDGGAYVHPDDREDERFFRDVVLPEPMSDDAQARALASMEWDLWCDEQDQRARVESVAVAFDRFLATPEGMQWTADAERARLAARSDEGPCLSINKVNAGTDARSAVQHRRVKERSKRRQVAIAACVAAKVDTGFGVGRSVMVNDPTALRLRKLRANVGVAARACMVSEKGFRARVCKMVTLTIRKVEDWHPSMVRDYLRRLRAWMKRHHGCGLRYVWVAELQKRGAVHYHIAVFVKHGQRFPTPDKSGMWPHGWSNVMDARDAVGYLMAYMKKGSAMNQFAFPPGCRIYGTGGQDEALKAARRWLSWPGFVQSRAAAGDRWERAPGGGWLDPDGVVWDSEYRICGVAGCWGVRRVADHGRPMQVDGPFSWLRAA